MQLLIKLEFFVSAKRAEMGNIGQMEKMIPLISREIPFG